MFSVGGVVSTTAWVQELSSLPQVRGATSTLHCFEGSMAHPQGHERAWLYLATCVGLEPQWLWSDRLTDECVGVWLLGRCTH